jgi:hypothetical protein
VAGLSIFDVVGALGVLLIIAAYLALQMAWLLPTTVLYSAANAVGAGLILVSLVAVFNLPAFLIELFWLLISLFGLWRSLTSHRYSSETEAPASLR